MRGTGRPAVSRLVEHFVSFRFSFLLIRLHNWMSLQMCSSLSRFWQLFPSTHMCVQGSERHHYLAYMNYSSAALSRMPTKLFVIYFTQISWCVILLLLSSGFARFLLKISSSLLLHQEICHSKTSYPLLQRYHSGSYNLCSSRHSLVPIQITKSTRTTKLATPGWDWRLSKNEDWVV